MAARQNRVASVFFTVASHAAETHPPRPRPSALQPLCLTRDHRLGVARPTASGDMRYTFSTNFVPVRRLVRRSAKRVGGSSLERRWKLCVAATPSSRALPSLDRGNPTALHLLHQFRQLGAEAGGLGSHINPCRFIGNLVAFVETRDVVDAARPEIHAAMLPCVDVTAENESRALFPDCRCQLGRSKMLRVRLERTVDITVGNTRRRMCD